MYGHDGEPHHNRFVHGDGSELACEPLAAVFLVDHRVVEIRCGGLPPSYVLYAALPITLQATSISKRPGPGYG
jgi:hypothetical protein